MKKIKVLEAGFGTPFGKAGMEVIVWGWYENTDHNKVGMDFMGTALSDDKYMKYMADKGSSFFHVKISGNAVFRFFEKVTFIRKTVRENQFDIVHIHATNAWGAFQYYLAAAPYCSKIIIHSHSTGIGFDSAKNTQRKLRFILHKICRHLINGKKVIRLGCSEDAAKWMFPQKYKYTVIKNGIKAADFVFNGNIRSRIRSGLGIENKFVIGHVGRFSYAKNHEFLIDVFEAVHKKNPHSILLLIGTGTLWEHIKEKVKKAGLDKAVIFFGNTENTNEFYFAMDCFVFPSRFEGLPIATVESQAAGLCTLCSDAVPSEAKITELLEFMPLSESPESWAEKILLYNNGYARCDMSQKIKEAGYGIESSARQLEELYLGFKKEN